MDDIWNGAEEASGTFDGTTGPSILINGTTVPLVTGESFKDAIISAARNAGFGKFRVFLNGSEMLPKDAPPFVGTSDQIEVRPYDVAGC